MEDNAKFQSMFYNSYINLYLDFFRYSLSALRGDSVFLDELDVLVGQLQHEGLETGEHSHENHRTHQLLIYFRKIRTNMALR